MAGSSFFVRCGYVDENAFAMRTLQVLSAPGVGCEMLYREAGRADAPVLLWLPGMGMPARSYLPLAAALAEQGLGVALHEWRGTGSSSERAARGADWGYRELLAEDIPAALEACRRRFPGAPVLLGGHSLGSQLACLYAALHPGAVRGIALVAGGSPYWRCFRPWGPMLRVAFAAAPWIARLRGHFPGRRLRFAGNEARGVIDDWARSGRTGRYAAKGMPHDLEAALATQSSPVLALRMDADVLCPEASLRHLLKKMPRAPSESRVLDDSTLGVHADHFSWMQSPQGVAGHVAAWYERLL